jgi:hypothetical protein
VSPEPEATDDLEEKFYPEEIVGHSLPNKRKLRSRTAPTEYLVKVKWLDYPHEQNTDEPLLAFGKLKKSKGYDRNIGNVVPNLIADYANNNDLFDDPIFKTYHEHLCVVDEDIHEANLMISVVPTHPPCPGFRLLSFPGGGCAH